jgi:hypothetical protein
LSEAPAPPDGDRASTLEREAQRPETGLLREYWQFLREEKKWWLAPILVVLLVTGGLIVVGGTAVGPFIYALF